MTLIEQIFKNYSKGVKKDPTSTIEVVKPSTAPTTVYPKIVSFSELEDILEANDIIGITGYPGAGKTTLSKHGSNREIIHTDDYLKYNHKIIPDLIIRDLKQKDRYIIEGTQVTRLLSRGWEPDVLIVVLGSKRTDTQGINKMIDNDLKESTCKIYTINPREFE